MSERTPLPVLPAASRAVTVSTLIPVCSTMPLADQVVVPAAVPLPPRSLLHVTCVTPTLSAAVPVTVSGVVVAVYVVSPVGVVITTVGAVPSGAGAVPTGVPASACSSATLSDRL